MQKIKLRKLTSKDISDKWISWLNDKSVNEYSDKISTRHTVKTQKIWLKKKIEEKSLILGMFVGHDHIGVCEITNISTKHKHCEIYYMIGNKLFLGKGYGVQLISLLCKYAKKYRIKKIIACTPENNIKSQKVLIKNNFVLEGNIKNFLKFKSKRISKLYFGKDI